MEEVRAPPPPPPPPWPPNGLSTGRGVGTPWLAAFAAATAAAMAWAEGLEEGEGGREVDRRARDMGRGAGVVAEGAKEEVGVGRSTGRPEVAIRLAAKLLAKAASTPPPKLELSCSATWAAAGSGADTLDARRLAALREAPSWEVPSGAKWEVGREVWRPGVVGFSVLEWRREAMRAAVRAASSAPFKAWASILQGKWTGLAGGLQGSWRRRGRPVSAIFATLTHSV